MSKNIIRIKTAVVDTRQLTLYKEDGPTVIIPQGDVRLRKILAEATPQLIAQGWADVDIAKEEESTYANFEKEGSGAVRFFRIAKAKLKSLLMAAEEPKPIDTSPVLPMTIGAVPTPVVANVQSDQKGPGVFTTMTIGRITTQLDDPMKDPYYPPTIALRVSSSTPVVEETEEIIQHAPSEPEVAHTMSVVDEIIAHAIPVGSPEFHEEGVAKQGNVVEENGGTLKDHGDSDQPDTIIAVVDDKVIPGMERIKSQFARAAKMGSTEGVEKFLQRLATVIEKRSHSVDDLLKFMERGDLPIADDGTILIYKVLNRGGHKDTKGVELITNMQCYTDVHSGKVTQFVGAYVCMDPALVDHNRSNECSNGLHVARRGYISGFSGNVCVVAKLAPEDVIAVPQYDANKMRVCGYHIIHELSEHQYSQLKSNRPITDNEEGKKLLARLLQGDHIDRTHEVRITGHKGQGVIITKIVKTMEDVPAQLVSDAAEAIEQFGDDELERFRDEQEAKTTVTKLVEVEALVNADVEVKDTPTSPLEVVKTVEVLSRKDQAAKLHAAVLNKEPGAIANLVLFKKQAKVGWDKLGVPDPTGTQTKEKQAKDAVKASLAPKPNTTPKLFPQVQNVVLDGEQDRSKLVLNDDGSDAPVSNSPKARITKLLAIGLDSAGVAQQILTIKKQAKKNWTVLGVSEDQVAQILKLAGA